MSLTHFGRIRTNKVRMFHIRLFARKIFTLLNKKLYFLSLVSLTRIPHNAILELKRFFRFFSFSKQMFSFRACLSTIPSIVFNADVSQKPKRKSAIL